MSTSRQIQQNKYIGIFDNIHVQGDSNNKTNTVDRETPILFQRDNNYPL